MTPDPKDIAKIRRRLLAWYVAEARDMPWRGVSDPYAVWVSEIMLQQTQVATVRPYYRRWMKRFPTVKALAAAPLDDVLKLWEGLGYYTRARNLHKAAGAVVRDHGGKIPRTMEALQKLPGIGRYTAAAVASIAFGLDEPVLDGNVQRVLSRVFRVTSPVKTTKTDKQLWTLAEQLIPAGKAGDFNQALMDLGATVCTPRKPACDVCPLAVCCQACARGEQDTLPKKVAKKPTPHYTIVAGVIEKGGRILIDRRSEEGMLGGLWEFPGGKVEKGETHAEALKREVREEVGLDVEVGELVTTVRHAYSHFKITLHAYRCSHVSGRARAIHCTAVKWIRPDELDDYAFPAANQKIIAAMRN